MKNRNFPYIPSLLSETLLQKFVTQCLISIEIFNLLTLINAQAYVYAQPYPQALINIWAFIPSNTGVTKITSVEFF